MSNVGLFNPAVSNRTDMTEDQLQRAACLRAASQLGDFLPEDLLTLGQFIATGQVVLQMRAVEGPVDAGLDVETVMARPLSWTPASSGPMVTVGGTTERMPSE